MAPPEDGYGDPGDGDGGWDWAPGNPVLRGETRTPDQMPLAVAELDEIPHRRRAALGLGTPDPDPGYDPAADDLADPA